MSSECFADHISCFLFKEPLKALLDFLSMLKGWQDLDAKLSRICRYVYD